MKKIGFILCLVLLNGLTYAQDFHFAQYYINPLSVNPALVGQFNGCVRMNALYRNQWGSLGGNNAFSTTAASFDMQLLKDKLKGNFIGAGVNFFNDKGGDLNYGTSAVGFNIGYCQILSKKQPMTISGGLQIGNWQKKLDVSNIRFENQLGVIAVTNNVSFMDFGVGVLYYHQPFSWLSYQSGMSLTHLNGSNQSMAHYTDNIGKRFQFHSTIFIQAADAFTVIPMITYSAQQKARELNLGSLVKVLIDDNGKWETALFFGMSARFTNPGVDATTAYFKFNVANLSIGLAYDVNISQLHVASQRLGGPELGLQYILGCPQSKATVYNKRKKLFCPKF
jgi:type IX secretion system PorP/SprF family membrane protein